MGGVGNNITFQICIKGKYVKSRNCKTLSYSNKYQNSLGIKDLWQDWRSIEKLIQPVTCSWRWSLKMWATNTLSLDFFFFNSFSKLVSTISAIDHSLTAHSLQCASIPQYYWSSDSNSFQFAWDSKSIDRFILTTGR